MSLGEIGRRWLAELPARLDDIADDWQLQIVDQLSGGTEALIFSVFQTDRPAVLKIGLPGSLAGEASTLKMAQGRGYVQLLDYDRGRDVMLLAPLGDRLADAALSSREQIKIICKTLNVAWQDVETTQYLVSGAEKARQQESYIQSNWDLLQPAYDSAICAQAISFAKDREQAFDPSKSVLVHGDAHIWNTLQSSQGTDDYLFVDPDGIFGEPAIDLAISMREWKEELLNGDTLSLGKARCALLSDLTGVNDQAIWQWGFIEHVACGLLDIQLNGKKAADQHLTIASRWLLS